MTNKHLYVLWGGMYILCAGLGFIPAPQGALKTLLTLLGIAFFLPGGVLLYRADKGRDHNTARIVCFLATGSLAATAIALILNFLSYGASEAAGDVLYAILVLVSSPMVCIQTWVLGLFGWACLLMTSISLLRKMKKGK